MPLIYTVALETNAFDPSYPTNIVPLSDLSMSTRVLDPLLAGPSHLISSSPSIDVKPMPVHVITGLRITARGGSIGPSASGNMTTFPLSSFEEVERRIL